MSWGEMSSHSCGERLLCGAEGTGIGILIRRGGLEGLVWRKMSSHSCGERLVRAVARVGQEVRLLEHDQSDSCVQWLVWGKKFGCWNMISGSCGARSSAAGT